MLEDQFAVRRGDVLGLLRAVGRDCAGAVTFHIGDADSREPAIATMSRDELEVVLVRPCGRTRHLLGWMLEQSRAHRPRNTVSATSS